VGVCGVCSRATRSVFDIQNNAPIENNGGNPAFNQPNLTQTVSASGFGHPVCGFGEEGVAEDLPETDPVSDVP
jgi:hypothetical protein